MNDPTQPPGSPEDFGRMRQEERDLRLAKANGGTLQDAEAEFQAEQRRIQIEAERLKKEREKLEKSRSQTPANVKYLMVSKTTNAVPGGAPKFSVIGFYSSPAALAEGLAGAVMAYAEAGQTIGTVEFDLSIKLDQPALPPK